MSTILSPTADAAALAPIVKQATSDLINGLTNSFAPAISSALKDALSELTISVEIKITQKGPTT